VRVWNVCGDFVCLSWVRRVVIVSHVWDGFLYVWIDMFVMGSNVYMWIFKKHTEKVRNQKV